MHLVKLRQSVSRSKVRVTSSSTWQWIRTVPITVCKEWLVDVRNYWASKRGGEGGGSKCQKPYFFLLLFSSQTIEEMGDISNSYWRYVPFSEIGYSPPGSGYLALQYWGNHFGPPSSKSYYFVMEINNRSAPFRIASKETAAKSGRLGHRSSRT